MATQVKHRKKVYRRRKLSRKERIQLFFLRAGFCTVIGVLIALFISPILWLIKEPFDNLMVGLILNYYSTQEKILYTTATIENSAEYVELNIAKDNSSIYTLSAVNAATIETSEETTTEETTTVVETTVETTEIGPILAPTEVTEPSISSKKVMRNLYFTSQMNMNSPSGVSREVFVDCVSDISYDHDKKGLFRRNAGNIWDICQEYQINEFYFLIMISYDSDWQSYMYARYNYTGVTENGGYIDYDHEYDYLRDVAAQYADYLNEDYGYNLEAVKDQVDPENDQFVPKIYTDLINLWTDLAT